MLALVLRNKDNNRLCGILTFKSVDDYADTKVYLETYRDKNVPIDVAIKNWKEESEIDFGIARWGEDLYV